MIRYTPTRDQWKEVVLWPWAGVWEAEGGTGLSVAVMVIECILRGVMTLGREIVSGVSWGSLVWGVAQRLKKPALATILELLYPQIDKKSRRGKRMVYVSPLVESLDRNEPSLHSTCQGGPKVSGASLPQPLGPSCFVDTDAPI